MPDNMERLNELNTKLMNSPLSMTKQEMEEFIKLCREEQRHAAGKRKQSRTKREEETPKKSTADFLSELLNM